MLVKRKYIILVSAVVLLGAGASYVGYKYLSNRSREGTQVVNSPVIEQLPVDKLVEDYEKAKKLIDEQSWEDAAAEFKKYADEVNNPLPLRISAYANCAYSAKNAQKTDLQSICLNAGNELITKVLDSEKPEAQNAFDALAQGKVYESEVPPEKQRE